MPVDGHRKFEGLRMSLKVAIQMDPVGAVNPLTDTLSLIHI